MDPSSIFRRIRWSVQEVNLAFVPTLVTLVYVGQIQGCLMCKRHPPFIAVPRMGRVSIVPDVDRYLDSLFLPLDDVRYRLILRKLEVATQNNVFTQVGGEMFGIVLNVS